MNFSDYEALWKRQELPVGSAADVARLEAEFAAKSRKMAAVRFVRDLLEALAGVAVSVALVFLWRRLGADGWPVGVAVVLVLGVSGVFLRERLGSRRRRASPEAILLVKVAADLAELRHQRNLFWTMWAWYLAPLLVAIILVHTALYMHAEPWEPLRAPVIHAGFGVFYAALFSLAWADNRRVVRRQLDPRIAELEKLHRELGSRI